MRLKARVHLTYAGKEWSPGQLFDAPTTHGMGMINAGDAEPFNLEDPSTRTFGDMLENLAPAAPALPDVPPVTISPTSATMSSTGGADTITVTVTGEGTSGTWTVDKDAAATWITIANPTEPQTESGVVQYNVNSNANAARVGHLYINGKTFTVNQAAEVSSRSKKA